MKKSKILSIVLGVMLILAMSVTLFACNEECTEHVDDNGDLICDKCGANLSTDDNGNQGQEGTDTYTLTLKDQNNAGVPDVQVQVLVDGKRGDVKYTDNNGAVSYEVKKNAVLVQINVLEWNNDYENTLDSDYIVFEDGFTYTIGGIIKKTEYVITVVDNNGAAVEGVEVQLCFGSICKTPKFTNKTGKATVLASDDPVDVYVSIKGLPEGYALQNGGIINDNTNSNYTKYTNFDENSAIQIVVDKLNVVTVNVGDLFAGALANIKVDIYNEDDEVVASGVSGANGKITFVLADGDYYLKAYHKDNDPTFVWMYHEEGVQDISGKTVRVDFVQKDSVDYVINVTRTTDNFGYAGLGVTFYNRLFEEVATSVALDENGSATVDLPYDVYYVQVVGLQDNCFADVTKLEKNGELEWTISVSDGAIPGSGSLTPITLVYGYNAGYTMSAGEVKHFKVYNPQGASLFIDSDNFNVTIGGTQCPVTDGFINGTLGDGAVETISIEAIGNVNATDWDINVQVEGTQDYAYYVDGEDLVNGEEDLEISLINGKAYVEFIANNDATLTITSLDDVTIYIDGQEKNSIALANGDGIIFYVVGEGEATINVTFEEKMVQYSVYVTKEREYTSGVSVDLMYNGTVIATAVSNEEGYAIFDNVKEYVASAVYAFVQPENVPAGYSVYPQIEAMGGAYFTAEVIYNEDTEEDEIVYMTSYIFDLIRDGSQNAPYEWHSEGITGMPTETVLYATAGQSIYVDFFGYLTDVRPPKYYVYTAGEVTIYVYKDTDADGEINFDSAEQATYDETKKATWFEAPVSQTIIIEVRPSADATITLKCKEGYVPDMSSGTEAEPEPDGTFDFPFELVAGEITTPAFIQGSLENEGIQAYYYVYTATADCTLTFELGTNAEVKQVIVSEVTGEIISADFVEGPIELVAGETVYFAFANEMFFTDAVTATVIIA